MQENGFEPKMGRQVDAPEPILRVVAWTRSGFTIIEIIAVLAIIGFLASMAIPRFIDVDQRGSRQVLVSALAELNGRESLTWSQAKISQTGWVEDAEVFARVDTDLGGDFRWTPQVTIGGGNLHFKVQMLRLEREPSLISRAGRWKVK